jgi:hypothetical protein
VGGAAGRAQSGASAARARRAGRGPPPRGRRRPSGAPNAIAPGLYSSESPLLQFLVERAQRAPQRRREPLCGLHRARAAAAPAAAALCRLHV